METKMEVEAGEKNDDKEKKKGVLCELGHSHKGVHF